MMAKMPKSETKGGINNMPITRQPIRIAQRAAKQSIQITLPTDETGWVVGDVIKYEIKDEDTIVLKRMHE